jgi:hypothetical protein
MSRRLLILLAVLFAVASAVAFGAAWYAMETGNGGVLLVVLVFLSSGLPDLVRRLKGESR